MNPFYNKDETYYRMFDLDEYSFCFNWAFHSYTAGIRRVLFFMGLGLFTADELIKERDIHFIFIAFLLLIHSFSPISISTVFFFIICESIPYSQFLSNIPLCVDKFVLIDKESPNGAT